MELRHLRYALAVAREGSFTRAASVLHVAQQALSHQVADLERELGVQLFHRLARGVRPTPAGAAFLAEARAIVAESEHAISEARRVARADAERIRVGTPPVSVPAVDHLLARLHRAHPSAAIELHQSLSRDHPHALQHGHIDIALSFVPPGAESDLEGAVVAAPPFSRAIVPADHPLAGAAAVWLRELAPTPMLLPDADLNPYLLGQIHDALAASGAAFTHSDVRLRGVPSAELVAVTGAWLLWFEGVQAAPGTVSLRIIDPPLAPHVWLLWRRDDPSAIVRQFVGTCVQATGAAGAEWRGRDVAVAPALPLLAD
jgi:DNA-binding transcriptional LysR family regulator